MAKAKNNEFVNLEYSVSMDAPSTHLFAVEIHFEGLDTASDTLELIMPVWRPGRYLIFDFSSGVQEFEAFGTNQNKLAWQKIDKSTWRIIRNSEPNVTVKYKVYANEFDLRTRGLNPEHAFINGTAVFMYAEKYRHSPLTLKVIPYQNWHVTTGLENIPGDDFTFTAPNYDYFVDCPLEIGNQTDFEFFVRGKKHVFSTYGKTNTEVNRDTLIADLTKIIEYNYDFWGSVPYEKYIFITHITPQSGGGTEHVNSTILGARPNVFDTPQSYTDYLRLVSHEFFHTWNVKQLKPAGLTPYNFTKENYTSELWIAEGGTSYYDGLNILRTGQYKLDEFIKEISSAIADDINKPGNRIQSVSESSFDAWVKFWRRTQNNYNSESDYYTRGSYISFILDMEIRHSSDNAHSLDDVFRAMFNDFPLDVKGYTNEDFRSYSEKMAGISLQQFFDDYVYGTKLVDWQKYLGYAGLEFKPDDSTQIAAVGLRAIQRDGKIVIVEIVSGSSAEEAGLSYGDEIAALNGVRMSYTEMENQFKHLKEGDKVSLTIVRGDKLSDVTLEIKSMKITSYKITKVAEPTDLQKRIYESWLKTSWE